MRVRRRQLVRGGLLVGGWALSGWPFLSASGGGVKIVAVTDDLDLVADDESRMRLAHVEFVRRKEADGTWLPVDKGLKNWLATRLVGLEPGEGVRFDRSGRRLIDPRIEEEKPISAELIASGRAIFRPDLGEATDPDALLQEEERARQARFGIWRDGGAGPFVHDKASDLIGHYGLVTGRILHSAETRYYVYANFGKRWKEDFTLRVPSHEVKSLVRDGLDLIALEGRVVRARGWVFEENGPMIQIAHRHAVEVIG
ncbi:MAG: hypothetical protein R3C97_18130 [Geminicoccaceae bacterium]